MQISEIFNSIENDGIKVGYLTTYIRTFSCNLSCNYCNSSYCIKPQSDEDLVGFTVMSVEEILDEVADYGNKNVTLIGGEPLLQKDAPELVAALLEEGYHVNIETNGSFVLSVFEDKMTDILSDDELVNNLTYTVDYKLPNSGEQDQMVESNLSFLIENDAVRFTVSTIADLDAIGEVLEEYEPIAQIYIIPLEMDAKNIVDYMIANSMQGVRIQLPLRKIIYGEDVHG